MSECLTEECTHDPVVVSDVIIWNGIRNDDTGAHPYSIRRQVLACQTCGTFIEQREVNRDSP